MQTIMNEQKNASSGKGCYSIADLMEILGVGRKSVMILLKQKVFPWIIVADKYYRIPVEPFEAWLNGDH